MANHLVQTCRSVAPAGATVIVDGLSPEIAQTLVTIGVDLTRWTVGGLQAALKRLSAARLQGAAV